MFSDVSELSYQSDIENNTNSISLDISNGAPIDTSKFIVVNYNINSILREGRIEELIETCNTMNISVLCITESKLDETVSVNKILLPGFHEPIRRDRILNGKPSKSGGCLIYIKESLLFEHKIYWQEEYFEHFWVNIIINKKKFAVNCLYRPPNHSSEDHNLFLATAQTVLQKLQNFHADYQIITSDLNYGIFIAKSHYYHQNH